MPLSSITDITIEMVTTIVAIIVGIAVLFKAVKDIRTLGWEPFKEKWITPRKARQKRLDKVIESVDRIEQTLNRVETELKTNGGTTIKDMVIRIDSKVEHIQARARHQDETSDLAIFELDEKGAMRVMNAAMRNLVEADEHQLLHLDYVSRLHSDDRTRFLRELRESIDHKMPLDSVVRFRRYNQYVTIRMTARPDVRNDGKLMGFFGFANLAGNFADQHITGT